MFSRFNVIAVLTILILVASCAAKGGKVDVGPSSSSGTPPMALALDIKKHTLNVELDPAGHTIKGRDVMSIEIPKDINSVTPIYFALHPQVTLKSLSVINQGKSEKIKYNAFASPDQLTIYTFNITAGVEFLECVYEGKIYDEVQGEQSLGFIRGGLTSGIISEKGIYLHHGTGWYPRTGLSPMMLFEVTAITPKGWEVVGQNELKERIEIGEKKDRIKTTWTSQVAFDSYSLVAGPYIVTEENHQGVRIATYFSKESQQFAQMHIDAAKEFITLYSQALTPYPFKSFSIVENFFTTGYGMPSYTLLGKDVIMSGRHANEGGLGHEIMHCWWGNYVNVDEKDGNWCEGLTSYCSNYYYLELKKTKQDAINYRRNTYVKFSAYVNDSNDYPARRFISKMGEQDSEIGYGKASMVFHMMRQTIGDQAFFDALRLVIKEHGAGKASWSDFQAAFEKSSGKKAGDLKWFFAQWLERTGAPVISIEDVALSNGADGSQQVSFAIKQSAKESYRFSIPFVLTTDQGQLTNTLDIIGSTQRATLPAPKGSTKVISLVFDPEYNIFRKFSRQELSPCLGMTLSDQNLIIICPTKGVADENSIYQKIAERVASTRTAAVKMDKDVTENELDGNSLLILGGPAINSVALKLSSSGALQVKENSFSIMGASYNESKYALMVSERNPFNKDKYVTVFMGLSKDAVERPGRTIFFYRWDQYVLFSAGRMAQKGDFNPPYNALEHRFQDAGQSSSAIDGNIIKKHAEYLASVDMGGRAPGSKGDKLSAEYIAGEFRKYGLKPPLKSNSYLESFPIPFRKLGKNTLLEIDGKQLVLGKDFLPYNFSGNADIDIQNCPAVFVEYGISAPEHQRDDYANKDVKDKVVLIKDGLPDAFPVTTTKYASVLSKVTNAGKHGAKAVLIYSIKGLDSPDIAWEEFPSQAIQQRVASDEPKQRNVSLRSMTLSSQSRLQPFPIPALLVNLNPDDSKENRRVTIKIHTAWEEVVNTANVIGILEGNDPLLKGEALIIGAHYDHLGLNYEGKAFAGGNDNASGVGGLLAIAEALAKKPSKRTIIFIAFGGEESGLWGSKFAAGISSANPFSKIDSSRAMMDYKKTAMLNLDMIGRGNLGELFIMGKAFNPELFEVVNKANASLSLNLKTNIDFLFKYGSDHASFHQAKVPALNFTSGPFEEEHTIGDTADKLMPDKMSQIATLVYQAALAIAGSDIKFPEPKDIEVSPPRTGRGHPGRSPAPK
ncbi:MAG: M28 family peptidase [Candidatus Brocadiia bacterium]